MSAPSLDTPLTRALGVDVPLICGPMYPCSNPELVAAVSAAGGVGVIQPISMTFVHKHDLREGIRLIRRLTDRPVGFNAIVETSSKVYVERMKRWLDVALEEGVRFVVSALGKPDWVVRAVHAAGGVVYHDVSKREWAEVALEQGVDGLVCVNARAGGHAGEASPERLMDELGDLGAPLICAGGVGSAEGFVRALAMGYAGVQMGTRFIATPECNSHADYKRAIVDAEESDIVLTRRISGIPVSVIRTPYMAEVGTEPGRLARRLLAHPKAKRWVRALFSVRSGFSLRGASLGGAGYRDYYQAGRSVGGVASIEPAGEIVRRFARAVTDAGSSGGLPT